MTPIGENELALILGEIRHLAMAVRRLEERAAQRERDDTILRSVQAVDANLVAGVENLVAGFGRLDADLVTGLERQATSAQQVEAALTAGAGEQARKVTELGQALQAWRDSVLASIQAADANLVAGLERFTEGFGRLDTDLVSGLERQTDASHALDARMATIAEEQAKKIAAINGAVQDWRDRVLTSMQALDANLVAGLDALNAGFARLDADVASGLQQQSAATQGLDARIAASALEQGAFASAISKALHEWRDGVLGSIQAVDEHLVAGLAQLGGGFTRLDADLVAGFERSTLAGRDADAREEARQRTLETRFDVLGAQMGDLAAVLARVDQTLVTFGERIAQTAQAQAQGLTETTHALQQLDAGTVKGFSTAAENFDRVDRALIAFGERIAQVADGQAHAQTETVRALQQLDAGTVKGLGAAAESFDRVDRALVAFGERIDQAADGQSHAQAETVRALQQLDAGTVKGLGDLSHAFRRVDRALVAFGERQAAASNERIAVSDQLLAGLQAVDGNLVKGLDRLTKTIAQLDVNVAAGVQTELDTLWEVKAALSGELGALASVRATPAAAPETPALTVAQGLAQALSLGADAAKPPHRIALPHPFSNMSRAEWADGIALWRQHAPRLLAKRKARACPACGEDKPHLLFRSYDDYPFSECTACGTWYVALRVDHELFERYFQLCPEAQRFSDYMLSQSEICSVEKSDEDRFKRYYAELRQLAPNAVSTIDIGCGVGNSLDAAAAFKFDAIGVEINANARAAAAAKGRRVVAKLSDAPEQSFDVITLWESLEHIDTTDEVMAFVGERLAKDGVLAITVPNLNSPSIRGLGADSMHVHGGTAFAGHINLFTQRSLATLLGRHGLEIVTAVGQYSMNLYELVGYHIGKWNGARDYLAKKKIEVELPEDVVQMISAVGPVVARWEERHAMAPILRVIAGRKRTARRR